MGAMKTSITGKKSLLRGWIPPEVIRIGRDWSGLGVRFRGDYSSWDEAAEQAEGYDSHRIVEQVKDATLRVKCGLANYERDGVLFFQADYPYPLIAGLLWIAAMHEGRLDVIDFGGALGSTYFQCRPFIERLPELHWRVIEQPHFVQCGRECIADETLSFSESIEECMQSGRPHVVILSSVLQYLPFPQKIMETIVRLGIEHIIIDRTPIICGVSEVIAVQENSPRIVKSSYPVRLFLRESLLAMVGKNYRLVTEFDALDGVHGSIMRRIEFKGFIFKKRFD
jgi:putative methyltransferase (TIGR04325 family)